MVFFFFGGGGQGLCVFWERWAWMHGMDRLSTPTVSDRLTMHPNKNIKKHTHVLTLASTNHFTPNNKKTIQTKNTHAPRAPPPSIHIHLTTTRTATPTPQLYHTTHIKKRTS